MRRLFGGQQLSKTVARLRMSVQSLFTNTINEDEDEDEDEVELIRV